MPLRAVAAPLVVAWKDAGMITRHDGHPPETACRPAGHAQCEPAPPGAVLVPWREAVILSRVPDLSRVPLAAIPALTRPDEGPEFSSAI